jgi:hypothetical protein
MGWNIRSIRMKKYDENTVVDEVVEANLLKQKKESIGIYIYAYYPAKKQAQDNGWKDNFRTKLVAGGVADIDTQIVTLATSFLKGKTLDEVLKGVDSKVKPMFEKLVKIAVKSEWMLDCINAGKTVIKNNVEADYPVFPKFD